MSPESAFSGFESSGMQGCYKSLRKSWKVLWRWFLLLWAWKVLHTLVWKLQFWKGHLTDSFFLMCVAIWAKYCEILQASEKLHRSQFTFDVALSNFEEAWKHWLCSQDKMLLQRQFTPKCTHTILIDAWEWTVTCLMAVFKLVMCD